MSASSAKTARIATDYHRDRALGPVESRRWWWLGGFECREFIEGRRAAELGAGGASGDDAGRTRGGTTGRARRRSSGLSCQRPGVAHDHDNNKPGSQPIAVASGKAVVLVNATSSITQISFTLAIAASDTNDNGDGDNDGGGGGDGGNPKSLSIRLLIPRTTAR